MSHLSDTDSSRRKFMAGTAAGFALAALSSNSALAAPATQQGTESRSEPHWTDQLKASETELLFAHSQEYLVTTSKTTPHDTILKVSAGLAKLAKELSIPITFAFVPDSKGEAAPILKLRDYLTRSNQYLRLAAPPFLDKAFTVHLRGHQRKNLIIAGYASEVVIQRTAHDAKLAGYDVYIPVDAVGSMSERTEQAAFDLITAAGGVLTPRGVSWRHSHMISAKRKVPRFSGQRKSSDTGEADLMLTSATGSRTGFKLHATITLPKASKSL